MVFQQRTRRGIHAGNSQSENSACSSISCLATKTLKEEGKRGKVLLTLSSFLKYGLHAESTTLWAVKLRLLSQASVTSTKSSSSLKCRNELKMLEWKSFHLNEYCCSPFGEDEEAAMASVPLVLTARGAIVVGRAPWYLPRGYLVAPLVFLLSEERALLPN